MLEPGEDITLAKRWREHGDIKARRRLIQSHLQFVAKIAKEYRKYKVPRDDLFQEGVIALTKAIERFDPERGITLATYAAHAIKGAMLDCVMRSRSPVDHGDPERTAE